ncbi:MAG: cation diffusion facilitator family transporter [Alkalispirochaeta sp.]
MRTVGITIVGAIVNIVLSGVKVVGGLAGHSAALVADGVHSLSDLVTDAVVIFGVRIAQRPPDDNHAFGHGRFETVSAFLVGLVLVGAGGLIGSQGVQRAIEIVAGGAVPPPRVATVLIALGSVLAKEILFHVTRYIGRRESSPALIANAWHHRSDALSSVAAVIGITGAIVLGEGWIILDPVTGILVSLLVVSVGGKTAIAALREMTDHALSDDECDELISIVRSVPGVEDPHNLKTRRLGPTVAVEIHFRVRGEMTVYDGHIRATEVERRIRDRFGSDATVITHVEPQIVPDGGDPQV